MYITTDVGLFVKHNHNLNMWIIKRHYPTIQHDDAQDILGQVYLYFVEKDILRQYDASKSKFDTWITSIIKNRCKNFFRNNMTLAFIKMDENLVYLEQDDA